MLAYAMPAPRNTLIILAKAPTPGAVKTRLIPPLSPEQAASLYAAFVRDLAASAARLTGIDCRLGCSPTTSDPLFKELAGRGFEPFAQRGQDLGARMANAIEDARRAGGDRIVLIGADLPTLPVRILNEAFERLEDHEVVLGPSRDGGYYLIGARSGTPPIFGDMPWGSETVLEKTLGALIEAKQSTYMLPFWYDVDTIHDLRFLRRHLAILQADSPEPVCPETARRLSEISGLLD